MGAAEEESLQALPPKMPEPSNIKDDDTDVPTRKPGSKGPGRKRTKTGCLTCRKRRIKCGEEKPTCQNCTKSKRHCEGYNQRVIFKDPLNAYRPPSSTTAQVSSTAPTLNHPSARHGNRDQKATAGLNPPAIAPRPPSSFGPSMRGPDASLEFVPSPALPGGDRRYSTFPDGGHGNSSNTKDASSKRHRALNEPVDVIDPPRALNPQKAQTSLGQVTHYDFNALLKIESSKESSITSSQTNAPLEWSSGPSPVVPYYQSYPTTTWMPPNAPFPLGDTHLPQQLGDPGKEPRVSGTWTQTRHGQIDQGSCMPSLPERNPSLHAPVVGQQVLLEEDRDDPYDISDDDIEIEDNNGTEGVWQGEMHDDHLGSNDLGIVVALQASRDDMGLGLRTYHSFLDRPDMLATYMPSPQATPMQDRTTAMIFCYFVNVTGPSISIFERHPANPSLMFQGVPVPKSQQHIWTYTFPTLALQNPALLHAMLALASLHIAKLQGGPITASLKHYAISLRRVAKSVSLPTRRGHPATLAAALLLAFYECWSADHQKWTNHLLGAKQLVREIDFANMTRYIERKRAQHQAQFRGKFSSNNDVKFSTSFDSEETDENLVGVLMGKKVRYGEYGHVDDFASEPYWPRNYTEKDLEIYETQRDLFWWYCKQDVYQSILGGGKLFMDYSSWSHCPPRAPIGRLNRIYGTFDHIILLMGRLADFAARDMKRKRAMMKANGGWFPPAAMQASNSSSQTGASSMPPQTPPPMPPFSGMVPGVKDAKLPMGFEPTRDGSPQSVQSEEIDIKVRTAEAEEEWQEIRNAFALLEDHFGPDFQALGPEFSAPIETPFGTALQYRTFGIAGTWLNYYMGLIFCYRAHPSMPPASMVAAGIMRKSTEYYANQIGRIAAGIAPECSFSTQVNPSVGAALIESSTCLFVSAVQYTDNAQRAWTIQCLHHIVRLTAWQTAMAIASGCEASWVKTYEAGKGPPYTRSVDDGLVPSVVPMSRRIDRAFIGKTNAERRLELEKPDRAHYALGVLGLEEDFQGLDVGESDV